MALTFNIAIGRRPQQPCRAAAPLACKSNPQALRTPFSSFLQRPGTEEDILSTHASTSICSGTDCASEATEGTALGDCRRCRYAIKSFQLFPRDKQRQCSSNPISSCTCIRSTYPSSCMKCVGGGGGGDGHGQQLVRVMHCNWSDPRMSGLFGNLYTTSAGLARHYAGPLPSQCFLRDMAGCLTVFFAGFTRVTPACLMVDSFVNPLTGSIGPQNRCRLCSGGSDYCITGMHCKQEPISSQQSKYWVQPARHTYSDRGRGPRKHEATTSLM